MTSTPKHTPGPWTVKPDSDLAHAHPYHRARLITTADFDEETNTGEIICRMSDAPNQAQNAALIAAAPELLEALQATVARMLENKPAKAKKKDLDAVFMVATFYRDLEAAKRIIATVQTSTPDDPTLHHNQTPPAKPLTDIELGNFPLHIPG